MSQPVEFAPMVGAGPTPSYAPPVDSPVVSADGAAAQRAATHRTRATYGDGARRAARGALLALAVAASAGMTWWAVKSGWNPETRSEKWQYVEAAGIETEKQGRPVVMFVNSRNQATPDTEIRLSPADEDVDTTAQVIAGHNNGADLAAMATIQAAQKLPQVHDATSNAPLVEVKPPTVSPAVVDKLSRGQSRLFRVDMVDCAAEDGDVVEILVNGATFATVPLVNSPATLVIPLESAIPNTISLRAVRDGGGGVTIEFVTSQGSYFCGAMAEGEEFSLGVVLP